MLANGYPDDRRLMFSRDQQHVGGHHDHQYQPASAQEQLLFATRVRAGRLQLSRAA